MRLINTETLLLEEFNSTETPRYAVLSHTWGSEEVSFQEYQDQKRSRYSKAGMEKIKHFCKKAASHKYQYAWVDTCCIDKSSSAELSEAINSMYQWYHDAGVCFIYLADVISNGNNMELLRALRGSRWFKRGWTLQELIAPPKRRFYAADWTCLSEQGSELIDNVAQITRVNKEVLLDRRRAKSLCVAQRMSWAASRDTTRPEDSAYSLMGLFGVNMPILYGEGELNAFKRLQLEIMTKSFDQTLFAWHSCYESSGLLARKVADFQNMPDLYLFSPTLLAPYTMTNIGLSIRVPFVGKPVPGDPSLLYVGLQCGIKTAAGWEIPLICVKPVAVASCIMNGKIVKAYRRIQTSELPVIQRFSVGRDHWEDIIVLEDSHIDSVEHAVDDDQSRKYGQWFSGEIRKQDKA
jgi:hypothetical protein